MVQKGSEHLAPGGACWRCGGRYCDHPSARGERSPVRRSHQRCARPSGTSQSLPSGWHSRCCSAILLNGAWHPVQPRAQVWHSRSWNKRGWFSAAPFNNVLLTDARSQTATVCPKERGAKAYPTRPSWAQTESFRNSPAHAALHSWLGRHASQCGLHLRSPVPTCIS